MAGITPAPGAKLEPDAIGAAQDTIIGDDLEQGEQHADRLARLFKLDHLTIRMRRYSHNLLVLAGHELPDYSDRPVELVNVIKAAVSEIEEYERVSLRAQPGIAVCGPAVNDVVHLLAELTENAASLSPADTSIVISGRQLASGGVLVDIIDQGFGMSAQEMAQANWRLETRRLRMSLSRRVWACSWLAGSLHGTASRSG